jgi:hypothetical protein
MKTHFLQVATQQGSSITPKRQSNSQLPGHLTAPYVPPGGDRTSLGGQQITLQGRMGGDRTSLGGQQVTLQGRITAAVTRTNAFTPAPVIDEGGDGVTLSEEVLGVTLKPHTSPPALPTPKPVTVPTAGSGRQLGTVNSSKDSVTSGTQQGKGLGKFGEVGVEFSPFMGMGRGVNLSDSSGELETVQPLTPPSGSTAGTVEKVQGSTAPGTAAVQPGAASVPPGAGSNPSASTILASRTIGPGLSPFAIAPAIEPEGAASAVERSSSRRSGPFRSQSEKQRTLASAYDSSIDSSSREAVAAGAGAGAGDRQGDRGDRGDISPRLQGVAAPSTRGSSRSAVLHYPRSRASGSAAVVGGDYPRPGSASPGVGNTPRSSMSPKGAPGSPESVRGASSGTIPAQRVGGHSMT